MASIEQELDSLSAQVLEVVDLVAAFKSNRIVNHETLYADPMVPRDHTSRLSQQHNAFDNRMSLANVLATKFFSIETQLDFIKVQLEQDVKTDVEKAKLGRRYEGLLEDFKFARSTFRRAQISNRKTATSIRSELFGDKINEHIDRRSRSAKEGSKIVSKAEEITNVLQNVRRMAETEALVSGINLETLEESTNTLRTLHDRYGGQNVLLKSSKALIRHMELADRQDRYMMFAAFGFLGLVIAWIVWRRILKAPTMLLFGVGKVVVKVGKKIGDVAYESQSIPSGTFQSTASIDTNVAETLAASIDTSVLTATTTTFTSFTGSTGVSLLTSMAGTIMSDLNDYISEDNILTVITTSGTVSTIYKTSSVHDEL